MALPPPMNVYVAPSAPLPVGQRGEMEIEYIPTKHPMSDFLANKRTASSLTTGCIAFWSAMLYLYVCIGLGGAGMAGVAAFSLFWARSLYGEVRAIIVSSCLVSPCKWLALRFLPTVQAPWAGGEDDLRDAFEEHMRTVQWMQRVATLSALLDAGLSIWAGSYTGIRSIMEQSTLEGWYISPVCAMLGLFLSLGAFCLGAYIEFSGVLKVREGTDLTEFALQSFQPVIYTKEEAAIITGDAEAMYMYKEKCRAVMHRFNQEGGITVALDPLDVTKIDETKIGQEPTMVIGAAFLQRAAGLVRGVSGGKNPSNDGDGDGDDDEDDAGGGGGGDRDIGNGNGNGNG